MRLAGDVVLQPCIFLLLKTQSETFLVPKPIVEPQCFCSISNSKARPDLFSFASVEKRQKRQAALIAEIEEMSGGNG
jgi:hypothetical protein